MEEHTAIRVARAIGNADLGGQTLSGFMRKIAPLFSKAFDEDSHTADLMILAKAAIKALAEDGPALHVEG